MLSFSSVLPQSQFGPRSLACPRAAPSHVAQIHTPLAVEPDPLRLEQPTLHDGPVTRSAPADPAFGVYDTMPRNIAAEWDPCHRVANEPRRAPPDDGRDLPVCGHPPRRNRPDDVTDTIVDRAITWQMLCPPCVLVPHAYFPAEPASSLTSRPRTITYAMSAKRKKTKSIHAMLCRVSMIVL